MTFEPWMKESFGRNGYLVVEGVLTPDEMADVGDRTDEMAADPTSAAPGVTISTEGDTVEDKADPASRNTTVRGTVFAARFDPIFQAFARHPKILELARGLLGAPVTLFRDQMLLKAPGGQGKPLHQDQSYFRVQPIDAMLTTWIALDPATRENGGMCYVPGSHRHGIFDVQPDPKRPVHHIPATHGLNLPEPVFCPVPAGSIIFHDGCTLHGSEANRTDTRRRAVIFHFIAKGARSEVEQMNSEISMQID